MNVPDPQANRDEWLAAHEGAEEVTAGEAQRRVAAQLGGAAPDPGVSSDDLGAQMHAQGAFAGLPYEQQMNALMDQVRAQQEQIQTLILRDHQREQAQIAALGEPVLQRYANAVRDYLKAHAAANPGLGPEHYAQPIADAEDLSRASADAISRGANDMGRVLSAASRLDRFFTKGHKRTAPAHLSAIDHGAAEQALEYVVREASRLSPGELVPA
jgi:hypothetical protein